VSQISGSNLNYDKEAVESKLIAELQQQLSYYPAQVSLNNTARRKEISRINQENVKILKTLRAVKPTLSRD